MGRAQAYITYVTLDGFINIWNFSCLKYINFEVTFPKLLRITYCTSKLRQNGNELVNKDEEKYRKHRK